MLDRAGSPVRADQPPAGVIDIGSNSVRLVVYEGGKRCPLTLFNEKGTCELGRGVARDGAIDAARLLAQFHPRLGEASIGVRHPARLAQGGGEDGLP